MVKITKAKYLSSCNSCSNDCTYLIKANKVYPKYLHLCTTCLLKLKKQLCVGGIDESQEQVER